MYSSFFSGVDYRVDYCASHAIIHGPWRLLLERAGIGNLRIHDLRHSFASGGLLVGEGLPMIGKLLGHNKVQTTARYAHLANVNDPVKCSAGSINLRPRRSCSQCGWRRTRRPAAPSASPTRCGPSIRAHVWRVHYTARCCGLEAHRDGPKEVIDYH